MQNKFLLHKKKFINFLKQNKLYKEDNDLVYENFIEKMENFSKYPFSSKFKWYLSIKNKCIAKISNKKIDALSNWNYDKKKGSLYHKSGKFFSIIGISVKNANREINRWDQPFIKQSNLTGGIIGLVRKKINGIPHYLVEAKYEPGNYNKIQISPSVQATFSNLERIHEGKKNKILNYYFNSHYDLIFKGWMSEDGGRFFKKRNLHWFIETKKKNKNFGKNFKWLTLWDIRMFIKKGTYVNPHLRAMLSLM